MRYAKESMKDEVQPIHDDRPWGSFDQFTKNEPSTVKIITVSAGQRLSLQRHHRREEFWHVISGSGTAEIGGVAQELSPGTNVYIGTEVTHRLSGGPDGIQILEIALGDFDENDIERLEDDYGRAV